MNLHDTKGLSPVISAIILIAVTVAVAVVAVSFLGSTSFNFMKTEEIRITDYMWAADNSYANITVINGGTDPVQIKSVQVDGKAATDYSFVSGSSTFDVGVTEKIIVSDFLRQTPNINLV